MKKFIENIVKWVKTNHPVLTTLFVALTTVGVCILKLMGINI